MNPKIVNFVETAAFRGQLPTKERLTRMEVSSFGRWVYAQYPKATASELSDLQAEYRKWFTELLSKFDANSPAGLTDDQKTKFFNLVKQNWQEGVGPKKPAGEIEVSKLRTTSRFGGRSTISHLLKR